VIRSFRRLLIFAFLGSVVLPPVAVISSLHSVGQQLSPGGKLKIACYCLLAAASVQGLLASARKFEPSLVEESLHQGEFLDVLPSTLVPLGIVIAAGLGLFLELAIIRWQASMFEFFAFYKNFGLLACFAGLGIGYATARHREGVPLCLSIVLFAWQFALLTFLRYGLPFGQSSSLEVVPFREQLNMGVDPAKPTEMVVIYLLLIAVFLLTVLAFLPIGQLCGRLMDRTGQLKAYGLNLFGSLLGVVLMFVVSFLWTPPVIWFGLSFLTLIFFVVRRSKSLFFAFSFSVLALLILAWPANPLWNRVYSPYQLLELGYGDNGLLSIRAAGHYYQRVHNLSNVAVRATSDPKLLRIRNYYELPYRIAGAGGDVAIVGAGSGNDVAAALRSGARHVEAIEIDPAILLAGKENHPERPYDDARVHAVVNDARSFFRNTQQQFDVVAYGLLDSHTLLSHASSVRLDSFVYTVEGLREARSRLKDHGVLSLSFAVINDALGTKIFQMMQQAFDGKPPFCIYADYDGSVIFIQSKNGDLQLPWKLLTASGFIEHSELYRTSGIPVDVSTDDWPFLYMPRRIYPVSYIPMLALVILLSFFLSRSFFDEKPQISHLPFFFLGAGFMLVETKAITELGLVFGNTWQVIAIAVAGILTMSFLSNSAVQRLRWRSSFLPHLFVLVALFAGWWIAKAGGLPSSSLGRLGTALLLTCPIFFSGLVFSSLLAKESSVSGVMGMNLLGAMCGGVLEYNSMYFGFHFLYLLAMGLYALSFISTLLRAKPIVARSSAGQAVSVSNPSSGI
jgi:SAM-dependent methyltransferase